MLTNEIFNILKVSYVTPIFMQYLKIIIKNLLILQLLCLFLALCYFFIDIPLLLNSSFLRERYYVPLRILSIITSPGTQLAFWSSLFMWYLIIKQNSKAALIIYPIIASMILTNTLIRFIKIFIGRSRPDMLLYEGVYQLNLFSFERCFTSFPSGHASTFASILGLLAAKYPRQALIWIFLATALSLCRVFIGAHYLSDVLFGNYLGFAFTWYFYFTSQQKEPAFLSYTKEKLSWKPFHALKELLKKDGPLEQ